MKKTVIVTGALGGIGQSICKIFSENNYQVIGIDVRAEKSIPNCVHSIKFDLFKLVNDSAYRSQMFQELANRVDQLDVLVNNAAVQKLGASEEITLEDWNETLSVNLSGPMLLSQWSIPRLSNTSGFIVNISSIHQLLTKPKFVSYATSKSALVGLTKAMAVDLNGQVRVNCISPAAIETEMLRAGFDNDESAIDALRKLHPVQRIGYPDEVARVALFLASDEAKFINGANLQLDGGISSVLHDI